MLTSCRVVLFLSEPHSSKLISLICSDVSAETFSSCMQKVLVNEVLFLNLRVVADFTRMPVALFFLFVFFRIR